MAKIALSPPGAQQSHRFYAQFSVLGYVVYVPVGVCAKLILGPSAQIIIALHTKRVAWEKYAAWVGCWAKYGQVGWEKRC